MTFMTTSIIEFACYILNRIESLLTDKQQQSPGKILAFTKLSFNWHTCCFILQLYVCELCERVLVLSNRKNECTAPKS